MKTKKNKLDTPLRETILLWGIVSVSPMHKLVWDINHSLGFELIREPLHLSHAVIDNPDAPTLVEEGEDTFPWFRFVDTLQYYTIELIKNKSEISTFIPDMKMMDALLIVKGESLLFEKKKFHLQLNQVPGIQQAFEIPLEKIKSRHRYLLYS